MRGPSRPSGRDGPVRTDYEAVAREGVSGDDQPADRVRPDGGRAPVPAPPGAEEDLEEEGLSLDALPSAWTA